MMKFFCRKCQSKFAAQSLAACPTCKMVRSVYPCSMVHLTAEDPEGDLQSRYTTSRVLCGCKDTPSATNDVHWTAHPDAVSCVKCLELIKAQLEHQQEAAKAA